MEQDATSVAEQSSLLHAEELVAEPIRVCDVIPVTSDLIGNEQLEEHQQVNGEQDEHVQSDQEVALPCSFVPYVATMPASFATSPLYFPDDILARMEGTNCYEFTKRMLSQMETDWMHLSAILRAYLSMDKKQITCLDDSMWDPDEDFKHYKWALCNIYSRSTDFLIIQQGHRRVMAPVFDMMNHDFDSQVTHELDSKGNMSVFAGSDIPSGSEIFLMYGNFPNEKLRLVYGFAVPSNPYDAVQIYAPPIPADSTFAIKAQILNSKFGIIDPNAPHILCQNQSIPESLLCALRLIGLQSEDDVMTASEATYHTFDGVLSVENESGALMALREALHTMARRLALNLISDENLFAASGVQDATTMSNNSNGGAAAASHTEDAHVETEDQSYKRRSLQGPLSIRIYNSPKRPARAELET